MLIMSVATASNSLFLMFKLKMLSMFVLILIDISSDVEIENGEKKGQPWFFLSQECVFDMHLLSHGFLWQMVMSKATLGLFFIRQGHPVLHPLTLSNGPHIVLLLDLWFTKRNFQFTKRNLQFAKRNLQFTRSLAALRENYRLWKIGWYSRGILKKELKRTLSVQFYPLIRLQALTMSSFLPSIINYPPSPPNHWHIWDPMVKRA